MAIPIVIFAGHRIYLLLQRRRMLKQAARDTAEVSDIRSVWLDQPGQPLYYQGFALRYEGRNGVLYRAYFAYKPVEPLPLDLGSPVVLRQGIPPEVWTENLRMPFVRSTGMESLWMRQAMSCWHRIMH